MLEIDWNCIIAINIFFEAKQEGSTYVVTIKIGDIINEKKV